jgi:hypothetical protein
MCLRTVITHRQRTHKQQTHNLPRTLTPIQSQNPRGRATRTRRVCWCTSTRGATWWPSPEACPLSGVCAHTLPSANDSSRHTSTSTHTPPTTPMRVRAHTQQCQQVRRMTVCLWQQVQAVTASTRTVRTHTHCRASTCRPSWRPASRTTPCSCLRTHSTSPPSVISRRRCRYGIATGRATRASCSNGTTSTETTSPAPHTTTAHRHRHHHHRHHHRHHRLHHHRRRHPRTH